MDYLIDARNGGEGETELHRLEKEAYRTVLRTFCAQSSTLTWGKEGLLTELRNELRVSDDEHREILALVSSDRSIKLLREKVDQASKGNYVSSTKRQKVETTPSPNYATPAPKTVPVTLFNKNCRGDKLERPFHKSAPPPVFYQQNKNHNSKVKSYKKSALSEFGKNNCTDVIRIRETDKLIHEVKRVFGKENPNPATIEKAKMLLQDQEKALMEAINKLVAMSDGEKRSFN